MKFKAAEREDDRQEVFIDVREDRVGLYVAGIQIAVLTADCRLIAQLLSTEDALRLTDRGVGLDKCLGGSKVYCQ